MHIVENLLFSCRAPWVLKACDISKYEYIDGAIILDGRKMSSLDGFYGEVFSKFRMPDYVGRNFGGLSEALADLSWLDRDLYVVLIKNGGDVLSKESQGALEGFLDVLESIGEEWSFPVEQGEAWDRPAVPFHSLFEVDGNSAQPVLKILPEIFHS